MIEAGQYYSANQLRIQGLKEADWTVALWKCKKHIKLRIRQRTLSGAHSASHLGADAIDHYLGIAYEKILTGEWEWKENFSLSQQMIRIVNSYISKEVVNSKSAKGQALKIEYKDLEEEFYDLASPPSDEQEEQETEKQLKAIETAATGDEELEFLMEGIKEGQKRAEIADLLGINVRQFDKLREKLIRRVKAQQPSLI